MRQTPDGQPSDAQPTPWRAFPVIYCITLSDRPDRRRQAEAEFQRVGLDAHVEFHVAQRHPTDSEQGIYESHLACLRAGLAAGGAGASRIVVFEDDIIFRHYSAYRLAQAAKFMDSTPDWRLFFFGCFVDSSRPTQFDSVLKIRYRCTAHGYVINRRAAESLVALPWRGTAFDMVLRDICGDGAYTVYPAFAYQSGASTDNSNLRRLDRTRRLIGGMQRLQRWNEFSTRRLIPLIVIHVIIAMLLILLALRHYGVLGR
jgi:GR25 family glycosyltransferase involved in LPS biosynthesis